MIILHIIQAIAVLGLSVGVEEEVQLSEGHQDEHYIDGKHNIKYDQNSILGSEEMRKKIEGLSPDKARKELALIIQKMDVNGDGDLDEEELISWILINFKNMDEAEAREQLSEEDLNGDGKLTWNEYIKKNFGYTLVELKNMREKPDPSSDDKQLFQIINEDEIRFDLADRNDDDVLDDVEYRAFLHPYYYEHMHEFEVNRTLKDIDTNQDGDVSLEEFMGIHNHEQEWELVESQRFAEYDINKDGVLDKDEAKTWILPNNLEVSRQEVEHLILEADDNKDMVLNSEEIINHLELFLGSESGKRDEL